MFNMQHSSGREFKSVEVYDRPWSRLSVCSSASSSASSEPEYASIDEVSIDSSIVPVDPLEKLQSELAVLTSKALEVQSDRRQRAVSRKFNRDLRERASLRLKMEQDDEKIRNEFVLRRLSDSLEHSAGLCTVTYRSCQSATNLDKMRKQSATNLDKKRKHVNFESEDSCSDLKTRKATRFDLNVIQRLAKRRRVKKCVYGDNHNQSLVDEDRPTRSDCLFGFLRRR